MENGGFHKTQVVIVGAGPTGLSMAALLHRYGINFIIIEKNAGITTLSKAIVVQARSLEIFYELGIAEEAMKRGQIATVIRLFYKGKQKLKVDLQGSGQGISAYTFALSLEQSKTEQLLVDHLAAQGIHVQWKSELVYFEQHKDGVTVYYNDAQGAAQKIEAAYLVGCDGAGSTVRHQLGLFFKGSTEPKLFYVADVVLNSPVINQNGVYMYMIPKGFVLFFAMEGDRHYRVVGILPEQHGDTEVQFTDVEREIKQNIISPVVFEKLQWFSTYKVHSRMADAFTKGRCFIAGDAAHIHTPAGGQGMNTGIQDAYNLTWKLAYTIRGEVNDTVLPTYDTERTANAKRLLKTTDRMFDIMSGVNRYWNFLRLHFFPLLLRTLAKSRLVQRRIFPLLSQTGIAYPDSYLTIKSAVGKVKGGDRMHYFVFSDGTQIFSYLTEPTFKLLYFGRDRTTPPPGYKIKVAFYCFEEVPVHVFGHATDFYILLRPDNHVSYIGKDEAMCRALINKIAAG